MDNTRKTWDKGEWAAKARERDMEAQTVARERDQAMREGRPYRPSEKQGEATAHVEERGDLGLDKNRGRTKLVQTGDRGAGFYCDLCNRTFKDSLSYLDHINSRFHLSKLGQSTHVARSTVAQVRARIAQLREQSKNKVDAQNFDFNKRLAEVRGAEQAKRDARRDERRRKRAEARAAEELGRVGVEKGASAQQVQQATEEMKGIEEMMGFAGFGGKRK